jgi:hypothetical protein
MSYTPVTNNPIDDTTPEPTMGPTSARPLFPAVTQMYFDTTLDEPIWWNGSGWINAMGASV